MAKKSFTDICNEILALYARLDINAIKAELAKIDTKTTDTSKILEQTKAEKAQAFAKIAELIATAKADFAKIKDDIADQATQISKNGADILSNFSDKKADLAQIVQELTDIATNNAKDEIGVFALSQSEKIAERTAVELDKIQPQITAFLADLTEKKAQIAELKEALSKDLNEFANNTKTELLANLAYLDSLFDEKANEHLQSLINIARAAKKELETQKEQIATFMAEQKAELAKTHELTFGADYKVLDVLNGLNLAKIRISWLEAQQKAEILHTRLIRRELKTRNAELKAQNDELLKNNEESRAYLAQIRKFFAITHEGTSYETDLSVF